MAKKNNIITLIRIICNIQYQAPNANFLTCFQTAVKRVLMAYLDEKRALRAFMDFLPSRIKDSRVTFLEPHASNRACERAQSEATSEHFSATPYPKPSLDPSPTGQDDVFFLLLTNH